MRFNKAELITLSKDSSIRFDKEGLLIITERQEGLFWNTDVNLPRWCKLHGNLLFYLKDHDPRSTTAGVLVLENCRPIIRNDEREPDGYVFILEFEGSISQRICSNTAEDRLDWVKCIQLASHKYLNQQIKYLKDRIAQAKLYREFEKMGNRIEVGAREQQHQQQQQQQQLQNSNSNNNNNIHFEEDLSELPICESVLSCDNLPNDAQGRPPNVRVICSALHSNGDGLWRECATTELVERSRTPQFMCTMRFRRSAGFTVDTLLRFTVYDVREVVSMTQLPLGHAEVALGVIKDATRFRLPLRSVRGECGYITIASWTPDVNGLMGAGAGAGAGVVVGGGGQVVVVVGPPTRSTTQEFDAKTTTLQQLQQQQQHRGNHHQHHHKHRRTQSLPPKLGTGLFVPPHCGLQRVCANPRLHTYRLRSALGADICIQETLLESRMCFAIPQQLLSIWIQREKELLQEVSGMGELSGEWRWRQINLLEEHLHLLKDYSQAKQNIQQMMRHGRDSNSSSDLGGMTMVDGEGGDSPSNTAAAAASKVFFKRSSVKTDESLEFLPVNLHLQRMWAQNEILQRSGYLDIITVGAFTRHDAKARKCGGLIKLLQESKSWKLEQSNACNVQAANDAVQATKQLREEIVQLMSQLLQLAKTKTTKGMMPLCNAMITKTRTLLTIWEPTIVEEAVAFIEQHRIIEEPENVLMEATTTTTTTTTTTGTATTATTAMSPFRKITQQLCALDLKSPELEDFATPIVAPPDLWPRTQQTNKTHTSHPLMRSNSWHPSPSSPSSSSLDINAIDSLRHVVQAYNEHLRTIEQQQQQQQSNEHQSLPVELQQLIDVDEKRTTTTTAMTTTMTTTPAGFLDTKIMSSSPSANYYRPTEEPEPLDLTQLNIEASVMCLVSKIKFFCGRCDSPAIRLRQPKRRAGFATPPTATATTTTTTTKAEEAATARGGGGGSVITLQEQPPDVLNLDLTPTTTTTKKGNKFTDGLDLSLTPDWTAELRPSMRKLRHAMDRLLKTARLMHSVQRLHQDIRLNSLQSSITYRRDVCFSQALTALISALMVKLWGTELNMAYIQLLRDLGPLAYFEGLLSLFGGEVDMWSDMCIAIEDLTAVNFTLIRAPINGETMPMPRVTGSRNALDVFLPIPEHIYSSGLLCSSGPTIQFKVTAVFFNIGINEKATLAETLGQTREQHRSNWDNYLRLSQYFSRYKKLPQQQQQQSTVQQVDALQSLLTFMENQLRANVSKNVKILHLVEDACRQMSGLRFTSCKSAKDRTGMAVTLEQCRVLVREFQLPAKHVPTALSTMRSEGTRMDNVEKNIGKKKYAFNLPQVLSLPAMYRPPVGCYGKAET